MNKKTIISALLIVSPFIQAEETKLNLVKDRIEIATKELCNEKDIQKLFDDKTFSNNTFKVNLNSSFSYSQGLYDYSVYVDLGELEFEKYCPEITKSTFNKNIDRLMNESSKLSFDGNLVAFNNKYYLSEKIYSFDYKLKTNNFIKIDNFSYYSFNVYFDNKNSITLYFRDKEKGEAEILKLKKYLNK